jgi:hypothetical protein
MEKIGWKDSTIFEKDIRDQRVFKNELIFGEHLVHILIAHVLKHC